MHFKKNPSLYRSKKEHPKCIKIMIKNQIVYGKKKTQWNICTFSCSKMKSFEWKMIKKIIEKCVFNWLFVSRCKMLCDNVNIQRVVVLMNENVEKMQEMKRKIMPRGGSMIFNDDFNDEKRGKSRIMRIIHNWKVPWEMWRWENSENSTKIDKIWNFSTHKTIFTSREWDDRRIEREIFTKNSHPFHLFSFILLFVFDGWRLKLGCVEKHRKKHNKIFVWKNENFLIQLHATQL